MAIQPPWLQNHNEAEHYLEFTKKKVSVAYTSLWSKEAAKFLATVFHERLFHRCVLVYVCVNVCVNVCVVCVNVCICVCVCVCVGQHRLWHRENTEEHTWGMNSILQLELTASPRRCAIRD